jgi:hypothetical protein
MLHTAITAVFAAAEAAGEESEPSKTAFYILGGSLAVWAVLLSGIGLSRSEFPGNKAGQRIVIAISALLVAAAMASAVATS